jgi:hypothetical protein
MSTCEAEKCTRQAVYHVSVKNVAGVDFQRNYCPIHTRGIGHEMARKIEGSSKLHEFLEVEHVNA